MIKKTVDLAKLTSINLDGQIDIGILESLDDVKNLEEYFFIFGGGSNLLVKNKNLNFYKLSERFSYAKIKDNILVCGAALRLSSLMRFLIESRISSLEFLAGVPATLGGAVFMNAGAFRNSIADKILYVKVFCKNSGTVILPREKLNFGYRYSGLDGCVILEAGFSYKRVDKTEIENEIRNNIKTRLIKAHLKNTFGSVFKNPTNDFAGKLIEESGLKGLKKNSAEISKKHANYIIGSKRTYIDDVLFLMDRAKEAVLKNFGIELEEEVRII